jgi:diguanylate cyclase (GGDEF)-like protein
VAAEDMAKNAALHDALTGLPNRTRFLELLEEKLTAAKADAVSEPLAVLVIHVPGLQRMYDALGHDSLNEMFVEIAARLRRGRFDEQGLARVQDNDFAVFHEHTDAERAGALAQELLRCFELPVTVDSAPIEVRACVGAAFFPGLGQEAEILLRRAAIAARDAARKDLSFNVYRGMKERENAAGLALVAELRTAIDSRALRLHYQPKIALASGVVCGSEALIRWPHPSKGLIPPVQFVPLAEQTGLIRSLTYFVIEAAVRQVRAWTDSGVSMPVAVNLSARNLYDPKLFERIEAIVTTWGIDPKLLEVEITEGALVEDTQTARAVLTRLSALCGKIYIDDFGTGYSSLSYLVSLPVHALKIDRAFVIQMTKSRQARSVVESVISMAHALGMRVVAEGVETAEDAAILRELGCDEAQGYFFGKPVPAAEFKSGSGTG